ncbi:MAG: AsmA family protein [Desulfobacterales bacterium]|nr:AsmA family protein [Desulfobacterales bacterium]MDD4072388.1 AsmA family protein [Desulfobacterales bacterium]MDD4392349.1 AsmA family protein [Desulfobacterales bacterium]
MNKIIKWIAMGVGALVVIVLAALIFIPKLVDMEQYRPRIEQQVAKAIGRPFSLGKDLQLSLFPWAGISFTDLSIGSPPDFREKNFMTVKSFEARVKLIPLLFRDIQVKRFVLKGPQIVLETLADGRVNWEFKPEKEPVVVPEVPKGPSPAKKGGGGFSIKSLAVGEFSISGGSLLWVDHGKKQQKEITDIRLDLEDVSFDRPIRLILSAMIAQVPVSLQGTIGPVGKDIGKNALPVEITVQAAEQIHMNVSGTVSDWVDSPRYDLKIDLASFSPRRLMGAVFPERPFPVKTSAPDVLDRVSLKAELKGDTQKVDLTSAVAILDDSRFEFDLRVKNFAKPDLTFDVKLDKIDVDRYLPPPVVPGKAKEGRAPQSPSVSGEKKMDYSPLRRMALNGAVSIGELKAVNARLAQVKLKADAKDGIIRLGSLSFDLYQGHIEGSAGINVQKDIPGTHVELTANQIQVGPLLGDVMQLDVLEGAMEAKVAIDASGDAPESIKRTLNGNGNIRFLDGAVKGIDLAGMVRNAQAAFGLAEKPEEKPRTDFSEIEVPFDISNGRVHTANARLMSPVIRITAMGDADLVKEVLDFRVEPKFVATLIGQGDTVERSGIMVPILVSGSFSSPRFRPDLKGMIQQKLEGQVPDIPDITKTITDKEALKKTLKPLEETAKEVLKGLPFGP